MTKPLLYGAWISKNEFIPVQEECHAEIDLKLLNSTLKVNQEHDTKKFTVYKVMFRLGYVRVIYYSQESYSVEYWQGATFSKYQKDFINQAESKYPLKIFAHEWKG